MKIKRVKKTKQKIINNKIGADKKAPIIINKKNRTVKKL